jgi:hypothetical protein
VVVKPEMASNRQYHIGGKVAGKIERKRAEHAGEKPDDGDRGQAVTREKPASGRTGGERGRN